MNLYAQDYSSRGTDFWAGYGSHSSMYNLNGSIKLNGGTQQMIFYFYSAVNANVTVQIPATGWTRTYNVAANTFVESDAMPKTGPNDARIDSEGVFNNGIHITSDQNIAAYAHIFDAGSSATTLLLPTTILGQNYFSLNFTQKSDNPISNSFCFIVATQDSTIVIVTPSVKTLNHPAKVPFTQTLQKGQILSLIGTNNGNLIPPFTGGDLTGTHIETENNNDSSGCKPIAVFCGSSSISINCQPSLSSTSDNIFQEALPAKLKGREFITIPAKDFSHNIYRVLVYDTGTVVTENGILLTPVNSKYYEFETNKTSVIESNKSVSVAQYFTSANTCTNNLIGTNGDPEMIYQTPVQEDFNNAAFYSTSHSSATMHYVNIIKRYRDSSITLDNIPIEAAFTRVAFDTNYATAQIQVAAGIHQIHTDSAFSAIAYGYGNLESYGYNLGFVDLAGQPQLAIKNPYGDYIQAKTCNATSFKLAVSFPFEASSINWDFLNNNNLSPNNNIFIPNPQPDSLAAPDTFGLYRYTLPAFYTTDTIINIPVVITVTKPTEDGCFDTAQYNLTITVFPKPSADWLTNSKACENVPMQFQDNSNNYGVGLNQWFWNFGNIIKDSIQNPIQSFQAGNYNISLRCVDTIGCFGDTIKPLFVASFPIASFGMQGNDCVGSSVNFLDSSSIELGNISQWNWDFGDGSASSLQNPSKIFSSADTLNVKLFVLNAEGCSSDTISKQWTIYPYPQVKTQPDTFVVIGNSVHLQPVYQGIDLHYLWSPPSYLNSDTIPYPFASPMVSTSYQETITGAGGCATRVETYVYVIQFLEIPNAFSPNGDGINDTWVIKNIERYATASVQVFNRYGQPVFYSSGFYKPWDGTYNGKPLPVGTYYYIINPKNKYVPQSSGYVVILR